jgi:predicted RNA binding protein YcfA (HicA-like mRNA interferase family)
VRSREVVHRIRELGGEEVSQVGSHLKMRVGQCQTIVPMHSRDVSTGTLRAIERALEPCLGKGWLRGR